MNVIQAIETRRSIKRFTDAPVAPAELERLLAAAVLAPNHRLTQPWRFHVLGPSAHAAYGRIAADRKASKVADTAAADAVRRKVEAEYAAVPAMIAVSLRPAGDPEVREEDLAATFMALENLALAAIELGLGTHLRTGAVLEDPRVRAALEVPAGERVVALVQLGYPAEQPAPKPRVAATELTRWLP